MNTRSPTRTSRLRGSMRQIPRGSLGVKFSLMPPRIPSAARANKVLPAAVTNTNTPRLLIA